MKTTSFRFILAALAATVALAGCTKEITPPNFENDKVNPAAEGARVIAVSFASQTKTTLIEDGFQPVFVNGDKILVSNGQDEPDTCIVSVKDGKATISTNLTGTLKAVYPAKAAGMDEQNPKAIGGTRVFTEQDGTFANANICMVKNIPEDATTATFENKTAVFRIIPHTGKSAQYVEVRADGYDIANYFTDESEYKDDQLIHVEPITADTVYVSILVPPGLTVGNLTFSDGTNEKTVTGDKASTEIARGTLYTVTNENWKNNPEADIPEGALKGIFSVSATKKVRFSKGNLTCDISGETPDWKFYEHQYDCASGYDAKLISLFTWGYNAAYSIIPGGATFVSAHTTDGETLSRSEDWGYVFGGESSVWRTPSTDEWQYLFNKDNQYGETCRSGKYKFGVTVCSKTNCVVLLPDEWNTSVISLTDFASRAEYSETTTPKWSEMEEAGAVCLPAAGLRMSSSVNNVGALGRCWSSSVHDNYYVYYVAFTPLNVISGGNDSARDKGSSVRLVTDVSAAPTPAEPTSEYVEIAADYDNDPNTANTTLKWYRQNLAITDSGNKSWKGGNESAVKVPGTDVDVIVGDYFQWAAYENYALPVNDLGSGETDKGLLIYESFTNKYCVNGGSEDKFEVKSPEAGKKYQFDTDSDETYVGISPYYSGSTFNKYNNLDTKSILDTTSTDNDDVARIILGEKWRMPTSAEFKAMREATYWDWDDNDRGYYVYTPVIGDEGGLKGKKSDGVTDVTGFYAKADALLFFPAAGQGSDTDLSGAGLKGFYLSSTLYSSHMYYAYTLYISYGGAVYQQNHDIRYYGYSVRPVSE